MSETSLRWRQTVSAAMNPPSVTFTFSAGAGVLVIGAMAGAGGVDEWPTGAAFAFASAFSVCLRVRASSSLISLSSLCSSSDCFCNSSVWR